MSDSISSTIKQAILTDAHSDVTIHERPLVSELIWHNRQEEPLTWKMVFEGNPFKSKRLIIAHTIYYLLRCIFMGIILLVYSIYELIYRLLTGKRRNMRPSIAINFVLFSFTIVIAIIILVFNISFLVRNVILAPNEASINSNGVVSINQPCMETQYFYLLNAATYWTSSGIAVSRGDRVFISASGGMYSDIGEMSKKAFVNETLLYPRSVFAERNPSFIKRLFRKKQQNETIDNLGIQYCIYNDSVAHLSHGGTPRLGSLLCLVSTETQTPEYHFRNKGYGKTIHQIDYEKNEIRFTANKDECGILYFTFNDILLDSNTYGRIMKDTNSAAINMRKDLKSTNKSEYASIEDPTIWFKDNLGEALVNIRIEKSIRHSSLSTPDKFAMSFYRGFSRMKSNPWQSWIIWFLIIVGSLFICDIGLTHVLNREKDVIPQGEEQIKDKQ